MLTMSMKLMLRVFERYSTFIEYHEILSDK